ncbi:MAG: hypothetical protein MUF00_16815 [Gemmatimonadaceae bacterium]|nr:hypothetical protein [Gemmatimonadaceae bacterium]
MPLPFPIIGYHVTEASYSEEALEVPIEQSNLPDDIKVGHQLQLTKNTGAVRLSVSAIARRNAVEARASISVILMYGRPDEYSEHDLLQALSTAGVNTAFAMLRAEMHNLTRSGAFGPVQLDPVLLIVKQPDPSGDIAAG